MLDGRLDGSLVYKPLSVALQLILTHLLKGSLKVRTVWILIVMNALAKRFSEVSPRFA